MAGLYDRINAHDNVQVHYLVAGLKGYGAGIWTKQSVLDVINNQLGTPLTSEEVTDLDNIAIEIDGQANVTQKLIYANVIEAAMIAANDLAITDGQWRTALGIA